MTGAPYLLATRSAGKLRELRALFLAAGIAVEGLDEAGIGWAPGEEAVEAGDTFEANARAKAEWFAARSGRATIADDSGLAVDALGGAPGVRSKRWSGRADLTGEALDAANNARLQAALAGVADRRARYVCVAALCDSSGTRCWRGETTGTILTTPRGADGFGYDPYFRSDDLGVTFGEATLSAKAAVSHRGRAFAQLVAALRGAR